MTDSSSIMDLKKLLNPNNSGKIEDEIDTGSFLFEDNKKNYFKYDKKLNVNKEIKPEDKKELKNKTNTKKRIKYVLEIKVENEMKKLIINKDEDKNLFVNNFCKKYNINEEEDKNKILKIIEDRLKNLNGCKS